MDARLCRWGWVMVLLLALWPRPASAADAPDFQWRDDWQKFRPSELALTTAFGLEAAAAFALFPQPGANWRGGILFDDDVRDALVLHSRRSRDRAAAWSDNLYLALLAYPFLVDTALVSWGVHGDSDVATQMLAMNLEVYAVTGAIALTAEKVGRVRPAERGCRGDAEYSPKCGNDVDLRSSFLSGHTTLAFASAGATCAHHRHLALYGGGAPDVAACVLGLAAASTAGTLRIMSDNHYATDVLFGMGIGLLGGYGLPTWLHYDAGPSSEQAPHSFLPTIQRDVLGTPVLAVVAPQIAEEYAGITMVGMF